MSTALERLSAIEQELRVRSPRKDSGKRVKQTNVPVRTCYQAMVRLDGARDDVLDYAAWMMSLAIGPEDPCKGVLVPAAVEHDADDHLTLVLSRDLYEA
jgi:hypothetical protein